MKTGHKWIASDAVEEAESQLKVNEIIGATQSDRLGLGMRENLWWSTLTPPQRRRQVAEEVKRNDDSLRMVQAVTQKQQGAWTTWEEVVQRKLDWNHIWKMGQHRVSFLLRSVYDVLPTPANLSRWKGEQQACAACGRNGSLDHILTSCPASLAGGKYTWRHNEVLEVLVSGLHPVVEEANQKSSTQASNFITF